MKKLLALVSLLTVGLLVGGGEAKIVIDPAAKMKEMQDKTGAMIEDAKAKMDEGAAAIEGPTEGVKEAAEGAKEAVKEVAGDK